MTRRDAERLDDIELAIEVIHEHLARGGLIDGLVFDAVRVRLIEKGEAVKAISPELLSRESEIPWQDVAGMRVRLAHHYFDTSPAIVSATIDMDLPPLAAAVARLRAFIYVNWHSKHRFRGNNSCTGAASFF